MVVYYKFKSAKDYDVLRMDGQFITVGCLKRRIFEEKLNKGRDYDIIISNPQTNEEYVDEAALIFKNMPVLIRRVPGLRQNPIVVESRKQEVADMKEEEIPPLSSLVASDSSTMKYLEEPDWNDFGDDAFSIPKVPSAQSSILTDCSIQSTITDNEKIKASVETPPLDSICYGAGRGFARGISGGTMLGHGYGRCGFENKTPPTGYVCHRCKVAGHFIQHCRTNGDPSYDVKRVKPPTGIPKSMSPTPVALLPPELRCPMCKEVMKDAVFASKCCFRSYCDKCVRDHIISKSTCACGAINVHSDGLIPNKTLRDAIIHILSSISSSSSTENSGSAAVHVQDMESTRQVHPKAASSTKSTASNNEQKPYSIDDQSSDMKEGNKKIAEGKSEKKVVKDEMPYVEKKITKSSNGSDATLESFNAREEILPESLRVPEEVQDKLLAGEQGKRIKKKKTRMKGSAFNMQCGVSDLGSEGYFMMPYGGFMGYPSGPFDVTYYGGMISYDQYATRCSMMSAALPRDLSELAFSNTSMNQGFPMDMSGFDLWKADAGKHNTGQHNECVLSKNNRRFNDKEITNRGNGRSSLKAKPASLFLVIIFYPLVTYIIYIVTLYLLIICNTVTAQIYVVSRVGLSFCNFFVYNRVLLLLHYSQSRS